jgi:hypothetical protein
MPIRLLWKPIISDIGELRRAGHGRRGCDAVASASALGVTKEVSAVMAPTMCSRLDRAAMPPAWARR